MGHPSTPYADRGAGRDSVEPGRTFGSSPAPHANIRSVGAAGSPHAAFRRAIEARNLTRALAEARDLPQISLVDAAELVVLAAEQHGPSFERWAGRWAARYALEETNVTLDEAQLVLAGLAGLRQQTDRRPPLRSSRSSRTATGPTSERLFRRLLTTG